MTAEERDKLSVTAVIDGVTYTLEYEAKTDSFVLDALAPNHSSYPEPGHRYTIPVSVTSTEENVLPASVDVQLRVKELEAPIITPIYPVPGESILTATPTISWKIEDNDSGVEPKNVAAKLNGVLIPANSIQVQGALYSYTPGRLAAGISTLEYNAVDGDGNVASKQFTFTVDTPAPQITLSEPSTNFLITNSRVVILKGTVNAVAGIYPPFTVTVTVDGVDQGPVSIAADGSFEKRVQVKNGKSVIDVVATDAIGAASHVIVNVTCDQIKPEFITVEMTINQDMQTCTLVVDVIDKEE